MPEGRRGQIWRYAPEYRRPRHFHDEPELNLVVAGSGAFGTGSDIVRVTAGDFLCWLPGRDHELLEASADFDLFVAAMTPELCSRVMAEQRSTALAGSVRIRLAQSDSAELHSLCAVPLITAESSVVENRVAELWRRAHAIRQASRRPANLTERVVRSLLERPDLDRGDRARLVRGHPSELSRQFHRDFGLTLTAYRTRLRLLRFIQLADSGDRTLLRAALEAGFGSYSQCHRAFRAVLRCTPRAFFESGVRRLMAEAFSPFERAH